MPRGVRMDLYRYLTTSSASIAFAQFQRLTTKELFVEPTLKRTVDLEERQEHSEIILCICKHAHNV